MGQFNLYFLFLFFLAIFLLAIRAGAWVGARVYKRRGSPLEASEFLPSTVLGLLALIFGFTFSMAIGRYEKRVDLVLREANAIGTSYLRSQLVEQSFGEEIRKILRAYVQVRLDFFAAGSDLKRLNENIENSSALQRTLWTEVEKLTRKDRSAVAATLIQSLNEVIDLQTERYIALQNKVPEVVYWLIILIASVGLFSVGYTHATNNMSPGFFSACSLAVLFAIVLVTIQDLDRPRKGLIRVSQKAMEQVQEEFSRNSPSLNQRAPNPNPHF